MGRDPRWGRKLHLCWTKSRVGGTGATRAWSPATRPARTGQEARRRGGLPGGSWRPLAAKGARAPETMLPVEPTRRALGPAAAPECAAVQTSQTCSGLLQPRARGCDGPRQPPGRALELGRWKREGPHPIPGPRSLPAQALISWLIRNASFGVYFQNNVCWGTELFGLLSL